MFSSILSILPKKSRVANILVKVDNLSKQEHKKKEKQSADEKYGETLFIDEKSDDVLLLFAINGDGILVLNDLLLKYHTKKDSKLACNYNKLLLVISEAEFGIFCSLHDFYLSKN
ncbi:hypothetical protein J3Q64DRAFT_1704805 [Phycomyces blakesleeanus]|uniref:Uncharacterized protein n=1 Tax=Phycomyces blakesleeanus TaxID=4837 RepID=A0ABR3AG83_PHYBL